MKDVDTSLLNKLVTKLESEIRGLSSDQNKLIELMEALNYQFQTEHTGSAAQTKKDDRINRSLMSAAGNLDSTYSDYKRQTERTLDFFEGNLWNSFLLEAIKDHELVLNNTTS